MYGMRRSLGLRVVKSGRSLHLTWPKISTPLLQHLELDRSINHRRLPALISGDTSRTHGQLSPVVQWQILTVPLPLLPSIGRIEILMWRLSLTLTLLILRIRIPL